MTEQPRQRTVLLVEDNEDNRLIYSAILEHRGYRVLQAEDGEQGVVLACEHRPDLILMDISLPTIDGLLATRLLKADPCTKGIPIVAVTAHVFPGDQRTALDSGVDGYITKPAPPHDVLAAVERILGESSQQVQQGG